MLRSTGDSRSGAAGLQGLKHHPKAQTPLACTNKGAIQAWLNPSGWSRSGLEVTERNASRERHKGTRQDMTLNVGRCVIRRKVPPKPVTLLRLQEHQSAYQDTSNSLHGVHPGALALLPAITLPSCPHSSCSCPPWEAPGFPGALCKPSSTCKQG